VVTPSDLEAELRDRTTRRKATAWASAWWDLRTAAQILHDRAEIPVSVYSQPFTRRAMIDGAIVAYGRAFVGGARSEVANALPLVEEMGDNALSIHGEAMRWRHRHVAHRVDAEWEQGDARLLWGEVGAGSPTIRIRVVTAIGPEEHFASLLMHHAKTLADRVWERRLIPLKDKYLAKVDGPQLTLVKKHHAAVYEPPPPPEGAVGLTLDIGQDPAQADVR
jgi:hypothetical protein